MRRADKRIGDFERGFEGGIEGVMFKGTYGRWRDVLNADDVELYQQRLETSLPADAVDWVARGRAALEVP